MTSFKILHNMTHFDFFGPFFGGGGSRAATIALFLQSADFTLKTSIEYYLIKDILELVLRQSTTLDILDRS